MTENRLKNTLPLISPWQGSRLGRPSRPRPGLVARGEVEPDLVELAILSHTRTAQARPDGLPPVRTAFEELRAPEREVDTEQSVVKVEDSARTKRRAASSRLGPWIPGLLHFMAYSVSFVMYCVSAFVIGEISLLKFNATRGNYSDPITLCSDFRGSIPAQHARIYELRRAMCAWRVDPVNGRARLVKDIARQYAASDREITRAFGASAGAFPPARSSIRTSTPTSPPGATRSSRRSARTGPRPITSSAWYSTASATRRASSG
jgi:hypothetical protein